MGRSPCCSKVGLRRGPWSTKEDMLLTNYIQEHGEGQWRSLPKNAGLLRCGKSCRLRWMNYLRPGIKRGNISPDEEDLIIRLHSLLGNRWSLIAGRLPGRTDNEIKNYWNTHLLKKLKTAGIEPKAHKELPKPEKSPKTKSKKADEPTSQKKKKKQKKEDRDKEDNNNDDNDKSSKEEDEANALPKTTVYLPKPIRVSSVFSRTSSYDSLVSGGSSSSECDVEKDNGKVNEVSNTPWPLFDLLDSGFYGTGVCGEDEDFLLPLHHSDSSSDLQMFDKYYDEFVQLL